MYREMAIKFIINPGNANLLVNATQMAKVFNRRIDHFTRADETKRFIAALKKLPKDESLWSEFTPTGGNWGVKTDEFRGQFTPNGGNSDSFFMTEEDILQTKGHQGTWMHRLLALRFAAWLDPEFEVWIYVVIDNILFGNYKKHWEAHAAQEEAKDKMVLLKEKMLSNPNPEIVYQYFLNEEIVKNGVNEKRKAIKNQVDLFSYMNELN